MVITRTISQSKADLRAELARAAAEFQEKGGLITSLPTRSRVLRAAKDRKKKSVPRQERADEDKMISPEIWLGQGVVKQPAVAGRRGRLLAPRTPQLRESARVPAVVGAGRGFDIQRAAYVPVVEAV